MKLRFGFIGWTGVVVGLIVALTSCATRPKMSQGTIRQRLFGHLPDGRPVTLYTLVNNKGARADIMNYGGIVVRLYMPDRNGHYDDVVLGYDHLEGYLTNNPYFGAIVGRYANRIAKGRFVLDGKVYQLATNDGPNHLHGGIKGFDKRLWKARPFMSADGPALELKYFSRDGEEGYPGNLQVTAVYTLTDENELRLDFTAVTDKPTIVNLSHHSYFNLACEGTILDHQVMIVADAFTPVDATLIPTGEIRPVEGTPFDFRKPTPIGARIHEDDIQLKYGRGYDHNWVIRKPLGTLGLMARVYEPKTGRIMEVLSTEPGLQFYTGNFLDGTIVGKGGRRYVHRSGFCMEPQHYPDSPNKPHFPSVVLRPGQVYRNTIIYRFRAK